MCRFPLFCIFAAFSALAQPVPAPPAGAVEITPGTAVATVNGKKFTAGDLERITKNLTGSARQSAGAEPKSFLEQYAFSERLLAEAEKLKVDQISPWRERLEDARRQILAQALIAWKTEQAKVSPQEVTAYYKANRDSLREAFAKVIFVSRTGYVANIADGATKTTSPEETKAKAEKVAQLARDGRDFVALAKEYSDDRDTVDKGADLPYPVRANSNEIPQNMRNALLAAKVGEVVGPIEHDTGWYIFSVKSIGIPELDAGVKADIEKHLKNKMVQNWLAGLKAGVSVSLENQAFWDAFIAANKPPDPQHHEAGSK
jgi:parvulin-like peptidyl-prolyl isomerase